jgi:histidinol-phosphate aminotransferase
MIDDSIRKEVSKLKPYIPGKSADDAEEELGLSGVIKLASNENPLGPSPKALEVIAKRAKDLNVYPDQTSIELREALSKKLGIDKGCLIIGNGSDEIMQLAAATFLSAGEESIISENTFSIYEFATRLFDGQPVFVPLKDSRYALEGFASRITKKTKLIWLCNPNNPTGTIVTEKELSSFLSKVPRGVIAVIDEAYGDYVESGDFPKSIEYVKKGLNVIVLRTFSKIYGLAGLRAGYGIAKPDIIKYLNLTKLPFNVNRLAQAAAAAAAGDEGFAQKSRAMNSLGKKYLYSALDEMKVKYVKTEANFIFIDVGRNCDKVFMELMRQGVIIRPLASFGFGEAIRVTVGTEEQNKRFVAALKKVV